MLAHKIGQDTLIRTIHFLQVLQVKKFHLLVTKLTKKDQVYGQLYFHLVRIILRVGSLTQE
jgi:hypothetical protein